MRQWRSMLPVVIAIVGSSPAAGQRRPERFEGWTRMTFSQAEYRDRRRRLLDAVTADGGGVFLMPSASGLTGGDTFRQNENFLYFTGLELPRSMLVVDADRRTVTLYVPPRDPRWESSTRPNDFPGRDLGLDSAVVRMAAADSVLPSERLAGRIDELVRAGRRLIVDQGSGLDGRPGLIPQEGITPEMETVLALATRYPDLHPVNGSRLIARLRMVKSPAEIAAIERAVLAAALAMRQVAWQARPGVTERALIGAFEAACRREGAVRFPFTPVIKSGPNALWPWRILASHYDRRNRALAAGDIVIFDVGCELDYYVSDIGRTFPVGARFSPGQRRAVELVTAVSDSILKAIRPGMTLADVQRVAFAAIPPAERRYMQTGSYFGHHIGMSSGDPADLSVALAPGMVFTVEPWYYNHDSGVAAFVEDNVVVTTDGLTVLSRRLPRSPRGLEALHAGRAKPD